MMRAMVVSAARRRDAHRQRPLPVDRPGKDLVAGRLVHRQAFAGDRRLVDRRLAGQHHAVHGNPLARADQDAVADAQLLHRHLLLVVAVEQGRPPGREVHQAADGVAGAVHGVAFQRVAQGKEKHGHRALSPLADKDRADGGDGHQGVHVQGAGGAQAGPAGPGDVKPPTAMAAT